MAIQIPSGLPVNNTVDFHRNDLISPPSAPAVVESLSAIDPRVALNMPMPVVNSAAGHALHDALQDAAAKAGAANSQQLEPHVDSAVTLELSNEVGSNVLLNSAATKTDLSNLLSQNLSQLDRSGSAALGQLLSDILQVDIPDLGAQITAQTPSKEGAQEVATSEAVVTWPSKLAEAGQLPVDPKVAMNSLYQNLQQSGIFAADQLKKLLIPASSQEEDQRMGAESIREQATNLISQLSMDSPAVKDSVKLLLRGDVLWQGQLMPNVQGRMYREDAWEADPHEPNQLQKGSKLTLEVTLPNLGLVKVVGTQFGEAIHITLQGGGDAQRTFAENFENLLSQVRDQVDVDAQISLKSEGA